MFVGRHGVGKTSIILDAWKKAKLNYMYFSGATLDPWVDFIGIPEKHTDPDTGETYIKFIRPKAIAQDEVEAIFIDEYNRSHKKIRNAVMELIQFKSINGKVLKNLKIVWVAINPDEDDVNTYDVEKADPAQVDRFQIQVEIPYEPNRKFFSQKYGNDVASQAITWWKEQTEEVKNMVSPRRLEYTLDYYFLSGDLNDVLPAGANINSFVSKMKNTPAVNKLKGIFTTKNKAEGMAFLADEDNYSQTLAAIVDKKGLCEFFLPLMPDEKIAKLIAENDMARNTALWNYEKEPKLKEVLEEIVKAGANKELCTKITRHTKGSFERNWVNSAITKGVKKTNFKRYYYTVTNTNKIIPHCNVIQEMGLSDTHSRKSYYASLLPHIAQLMTYQELIKVLETIDKIAGKSHIKSIDNNYKNFMGLINHCLARMEELQKPLVKLEFVQKYPDLNKYIVANKDRFLFE